MSVCSDDQAKRDDESQHVGNRHGIQHAVEPEEAREQERKAHAEHDLSDHGEHGGFHRLPHRLQEDERRLVYAGEHDHAQVDAERFDCKIGVIDALIRRAEYLYQELREQLYDQQGDRTDDGFRDQQLCEQRLDAAMQLCSHIEADDRNTARRHSDDDGDHDLEELHHDTDDRHRYLRVLLLREDRIDRTVLSDHVVDRHHRRYQ